MNYYLVNYKFFSENARIAIPLKNRTDIDSLKSQIAAIRNVICPDAVEINDFKEVTEDVFNLISPFINSGIQEDGST